MKTVLTIIGARPQFIKAAVVSRAIVNHDGIEEMIIHTGQHYDANMSDIFFSEMGIPAPAHRLDISGGSHGVMTGRMLEAVEKILIENRPDAVMVYGDTNSTLAGALAASKMHIPLAHVEAGLRSFNKRMPEEINRIMTDHCSDILFTPTDTASQNLAQEGIDADRILQIGDVMHDAALLFGPLAEANVEIEKTFGVRPRNYILATIHRQENTDDPDRLRAIFEGLLKVAQDVPVVLPLHPRTQSYLAKMDIDTTSENLKLIAPLGYLEMVALERQALAIATDSGGVQKEAFFHQVPCVTLRDETEWVELVDAGWNRIVPPLNADTIAQNIRDAIGTQGKPITPYGTGDASTRIAQALDARLK